MIKLLEAEPVPTLLARIRDELSAEFRPNRPIRLSRAPGVLDVMGGIAEYTGSLTLKSTLGVAAAVALQVRDDDQLQIFSFDRFDDHKAFTLRMPLKALAEHDTATLAREFADPNRRWAAHLAGGLHVLHAERLIDLRSISNGLSLAVHSTIPPGAGLGASVATQVATLMNLVDQFDLHDRVDALAIATLSERVARELLGTPGGMAGRLASCDGASNELLRARCQPLDRLPPLHLPEGVTTLAIDSGVHSSACDSYDVTRVAAMIGHAIILHQMRELGAAAGATLTGDPMRGYLANLDPDDYKKLFRPHVPEQITGRAFLDRFGPPLDGAVVVDSQRVYLVQHATDHHVLEARRVRRFVESIEAASALPVGPQRKLQLDRAGHLMYASHQSYTMDAMLGEPDCDALVAAVRSREYAGFYGAKITGVGRGGAVAVLADDTDRMRESVGEIIEEHRAKSGRTASAIFGSSIGAWGVGTAIV